MNDPTKWRPAYHRALEVSEALQEPLNRLFAEKSDASMIDTSQIAYSENIAIHTADGSIVPAPTGPGVYCFDGQFYYRPRPLAVTFYDVPGY